LDCFHLFPELLKLHLTPKLRWDEAFWRMLRPTMPFRSHITNLMASELELSPGPSGLTPSSKKQEHGGDTNAAHGKTLYCAMEGCNS
jgi:hypothetical protein